MAGSRPHRRQVAIGLAASAVAARIDAAQAGEGTLFYASLGDDLLGFAVDPAAAALRQIHGPFATPAEVQACWNCADTGMLFAASSDQNTTKAGVNVLTAWRIQPDGSLRQIGPAARLPARPIFVTTDRRGRFVVTAYNRPALVTVHRVGAAGAVGPLVTQRRALDFGIYPHQVRVLPDDRRILVVARGNDPAPQRQEEPGSLRLYRFDDGQMSPLQVVSPGDGIGFRPRHADIGRTGTRLYVDLESQNRLQEYRLGPVGMDAAPIADLSTLAEPSHALLGQLASAVHLGRAGRTLYVANRGTHVGSYGERRVIRGENSIAVFNLDGAGRPALVQSAAVPGIHVRTFDMSRDGRWLLAATIASGDVESAGAVSSVEGGLFLFRVADDGTLTLVSQSRLSAPGRSAFWVGAVVH